MAECPLCKTPGAYIGFNSVECRNPDCEHFVLFEEEVCPCCGQPGHTPEKHAATIRQSSGGQQDTSQDSSATPDPNSPNNGSVYLDSSDPTLEPGISGD